MSEAIAFIAGTIAMMALWLWTDIKDNPYTKGYGDGYRNGYRNALLNQKQWIPVEERLPEKDDWNEAFIVTVQCEHVDGWDDYVVCGAEYSEYGWEYIPCPIGAIKVVAWMPMPVKPYRGETNEAQNDG